MNSTRTSAGTSVATGALGASGASGTGTFGISGNHNYSPTRGLTGSGLPDHLYYTAYKVDQLKREFPDKSDLLELFREEIFEAARQLEAPPEENFNRNMNMNNINTSPPGGEPRGGKRSKSKSKSKSRKAKRSKTRKSKSLLK